MAGRCRIKRDTQGVPRLEQQLPKPPGGSETRKVAATSVHGPLRKTHKTTSHSQSVLPAPHCFSQSCTRPLCGRHLESRQDRSLLHFRMKGQYAVQLFSGGNGFGTCMSAHGCRPMGFAARSLAVGQVLGEPRSTPVAACDVCFKK